MTNDDIRRTLEALDQIHFAERISVLEKLYTDHGDIVSDLLSKHVADQVAEEWSVLASIHPRCDIKELVEIQWEHISKSGGFEFEITSDNEGTQIHCTHCPLADMAHHLKAQKWAYLYYCHRSNTAVQSFNPKIGFERTKTLMQGDAYCNHRYFKK